MALKKRAALAGLPLAGMAAVDEEVAKLAPNLVDFLTQLEWEDGSKRRTGTVMVLAEDGVFKAWVHDRDGLRSCWVSGGCLQDLLLAVDQAVGGEEASWRADVKKGRGG